MKLFSFVILLLTNTLSSNVLFAADESDVQDMIRIHKCSALLNTKISSSWDIVPKKYRKHLSDHMLTLTSVLDGYISFSIPDGYDLALESAQVFQVLGSLHRKRAIAYSVEGSELRYFISTQQSGFGYAEIGSPDPEYGWHLVYDLICS